MHIATWKEQKQFEFFEGYELGLSQRSLPPNGASDYFWDGWAMGHVEAEGWLRELSLREKIRQWVRHTRADLRNWLQGLRRMDENCMIKRGDVTSIQVLHDDWCAVHVGRDCNCDPDIEMRNEEDCVDTINPLSASSILKN
jgi:hypothetical protein